MMDSRSAIATAWVRVSASSLARMWRTWLFTVSWLMKSREATSAFDIPSARSWRISRSRTVSISSLARQQGRHQRWIDVALSARDLLDGAEKRRVRGLLQDVALRAGLETAAEKTSLPVGGEDEHGCLGQALAEDLCRLESVHARHADVHDHDVRAPPLGDRDGAGAVRGLPDDPNLRSARQREAKPFADDLVVVSDQASDLARCSVSGQSDFPQGTMIIG